MQDLLKELRTDALDVENELIELRRELHQHPETGWSEFKTSQILHDKLAGAGFPDPGTVAGTGLYVDLLGNRNGPRIAYRADLDGLPIQDQKDKPYASRRTGFGHLCGHDVHSTIAYGIALLLKRHAGRMNGSVRIFWQPAEEVTPSGAPRILEEGILDGVEAIYGIHCDPSLPSGSFSARPGAETGSFDTFEVTIETESTTHSARPYEGKDTIWVAHQIIQHFYQMIGRISDVRNPCVLSVCTFHAGNALNVIPHHVTFGGTMRTMNEQLRQKLRKYMSEIAENMGRINQVEARIRFGGGAPSVMNNYQLYRFVRGLVSSELGDDKFLDREQSIGAEDFAYYTQKFPGLFLRMGTAHSKETSLPLHHSRFDVDERVLAPASAFLAFTLLSHLGKKILHARPRISSPSAAVIS